MTVPPWATGPAEILQHGVDLLAGDTDPSRRLAMISIDNAVELTIRTYLGLPERITGIRIPRRRLGEISGSFPDMLDALEECGGRTLDGIDLGEIEWFHRLRNELYHNGNGLTIERRHVETYAEIANLLWERLLGGPQDEAPEIPTASASDEQRLLLLGQFVRVWANVEEAISELAIAQAGGALPPGTRSRGTSVLHLFAHEGVIPQEMVDEAIQLRDIRNAVVHGDADTITSDALGRAMKLANDLAAIARALPETQPRPEPCSGESKP